MGLTSVVCIAGSVLQVDIVTGDGADHSWTYLMVGIGPAAAAAIRTNQVTRLSTRPES
jgi:hypothetical protein